MAQTRRGVETERQESGRWRALRRECVRGQRDWAVDEILTVQDFLFKGYF